MSGGSYDYTYSKIEMEYVVQMYDEELDDLMKDLVNVVHDLEWWQSGDYSEDKYRKTVKNFKDKWFKQDRVSRLKAYIDSEIENTRKSLYKMIESD